MTDVSLAILQKLREQSLREEPGNSLNESASVKEKKSEDKEKEPEDKAKEPKGELSEDGFYANIGRKLIEENGIFQCENCKSVLTPIDEEYEICPVCEDGELKRIELTEEKVKVFTHGKMVIKNRRPGWITRNGKLVKMSPHELAARRKSGKKNVKFTQRGAAKTTRKRSMKIRKSKVHEGEENTAQVTNAGGRFYLVDENDVVNLGLNIEEAAKTLTEIYEVDLPEAVKIVQEAMQGVVEI